MSRSRYMNDEQRHRIEMAYDSLQTTYEHLMAQYKTGSDSLSPQLSALYRRMQDMHRKMDANYHRMMSGDNQHMMGGGMMSGRMKMHMQGQMTGEWSRQMLGMHQQMAAMHQQNGQQRMAAMNQKMMREYQQFSDLIPADGDQNENYTGPESNEKASALNGEELFGQNCATCHGNDARGMAGVFPPLVKSPWVTGDKSIPVRIVRDGLTGSIEVGGQTYQGMMPSFKARLSNDQIAAILNYLRNKSKAGNEKITAKDISQIAGKYAQHARPWTAEELKR